MDARDWGRAEILELRKRTRTLDVAYSCHCIPRENKEVFAVTLRRFSHDHGAYHIRFIQPALWQETDENIDG